MRFISQRIHGILDYGVAFALIAAPIALDFAAVSMVAAAVSIAGGVGLVLYSLITDYSSGVRELISFRTHLVLDAVAAVALIVTPLLAGFSGVPQAFFTSVGVAVLAVVATTQLDAAASMAPEGALESSREAA